MKENACMTIVFQRDNTSVRIDLSREAMRGFLYLAFLSAYPLL